MNKLCFAITRFFFFIAVCGLCCCDWLVAQDQQGVQFFESKIRPVLVKSCYKCHSVETGKSKGGLVLDNRAGMIKGGESGKAVVPNDASSSLLLEAIRYESVEMPPDGKLPDDVIADFEKWIEMGAPDPRDVKQVVKKSIDFAAGRSFWSLQLPKRVEPPQHAHDQWSASDIDRFVLDKLKKAGLKPVQDAEALPLLKRDYINLIGLPPTPEQVEAFFNDTSENRREQLIDQLLDSPQFGERWGRHWLDLARFAESNGRERNFLFPHAWRYRNYVIDSFNADKPYDRFITEQIAGDLIDPLENQAADEPKIGTGFLAIGAKLLNEGNRDAFAMDMIDEQIDITMRSTMAITVSCARCHDHKFDPISTEDYYALAGIFRSTQTLFGTGGGGTRQKSALMQIGDEPPEAQQQRSEYRAKVAALTKKLSELNRQIVKPQQNGKQKKNKANKKNNPVSQSKLAELKKQQKQLYNERTELTNNAPAPPLVAMGVSEGKCVNCNVLVRGEISNRGKVIPRGFLTALGKGQRPVVSDTAKSGRLELAGWLTSPENPLTVRVIVNRVWRHLFDRGIVATVDNFGETGERPSHPELLDHLAIRFVENNWSIKKMIREIMLTRTYQLSAEFDQANYEIDPDNRLLWRMNIRRLDAEVIRDSMLVASGAIDLSRPESSVVAKYKATQGIGRGVNESDFQVNSNHRSVYLPIVRNAVPEVLRSFDFAEPSILVGDRKVTTVPTQALYLMNSEFVMDQSKRIADQLLSESTTDDLQIADEAYRRVLCRPASATECSRTVDFVQRITETLQGKENTTESQQARNLAWATFCQALLASAEFRCME